MKDQRDQIVKVKEAHTNLLLKISEMNTRFRTLGCRYRNEFNTLCEHPRHMMKKYPQHVPAPPQCSIEKCPRN